jgi:hypothetical protein
MRQYYVCTSIKPVGNMKRSKENIFCTQCFITCAKHDNGGRLNHSLRNILFNHIACRISSRRLAMKWWDTEHIYGYFNKEQKYWHSMLSVISILLLCIIS